MFEDKLFEEVLKLLPSTTTRSFSTDCGMSENYYCSVRSQGLRISTVALVHLAEVLEYRAGLNQISKSIEPVLMLIASEIAQRTQQTPTTSHVLQSIIGKAIAKINIRCTDEYDAPPIVIGW